MQLLGWSVVRCQLSDVSCQIFIRKLPLLGNIGKLQRPKGKLDPKKLDEFTKKHGLAALYIEPSLNTPVKIQNTKYKIHKDCFLPSKTIQIDLTQPQEKLFNQMKKDARYAVRFAQKQGVVIKESKDIETFIKLWQKSARSRGMWLPQKREIISLWNAFGPKAHCLVAYFDTPVYPSIPVAGALIVESPNTAYYMYAFSTREGKKFSAPTLLVWEAMKLAKKKKCKTFDFEGIYDERYPQTKNWKGFTRFKEGFGGKIVIYPKTLVRYYNPFVRIFL